MPKIIAQFLKLPNAEKYTGHAFRRTSATLLAESGADMAAIQRNGRWKSAQVAQGDVDESDALKNSTAQQISKNINLPTMEKMPNLAVDAEEQKNDANSDFQQSKAEEKKFKAERKSEKHYHFHNCTFNFKELQ